MEPMRFVAITACDHCCCSLCALRLRALQQDKRCPFCKAVNEIAVVSTVVARAPLPTFESLGVTDLAPAPGLDIDEQTGLAFLHCHSHFIDQMLLKRPHCFMCREIFPDNAALQEHLLAVPVNHQAIAKAVAAGKPAPAAGPPLKKQFCTLCLEHRLQFISEQRLFTPKELDKHNLDEREGHPVCHFCRKRFFDDRALHRHLTERHRSCPLCPEELKHRYYRDARSLELHCRDEHFMCDRCPSAHFAAFATHTELNAHLWEEHNIRAGPVNDTGMFAFRIADDPSRRHTLDAAAAASDSDEAEALRRGVAQADLWSGRGGARGAGGSAAGGRGRGRGRGDGAGRGGRGAGGAGEPLSVAAAAMALTAAEAEAATTSAGFVDSSAPRRAGGSWASAVSRGGGGSSSGSSAFPELVASHISVEEQARKDALRAQLSLADQAREQARRKREEELQLRALEEEHRAQCEQARNKRLDNALGTIATERDATPESALQRQLESLRRPLYPAELLEWALQHASELQRIERSLDAIIVTAFATRSLALSIPTSAPATSAAAPSSGMDLKPMARADRRAMHMLAEVYRLDSHAHGEEPRRYIRFTVRPDSELPTVRASAAAATYAQRLRATTQALSSAIRVAEGEAELGDVVLDGSDGAPANRAASLVRTALAQLQSKRPGITFFELRPGATGAELVARLRELAPELASSIRSARLLGLAIVQVEFRSFQAATDMLEALAQAACAASGRALGRTQLSQWEREPLDSADASEPASVRRWRSLVSHACAGRKSRAFVIPNEMRALAMFPVEEFLRFGGSSGSTSTAAALPGADSPGSSEREDEDAEGEGEPEVAEEASARFPNSVLRGLQPRTLPMEGGVSVGPEAREQQRREEREREREREREHERRVKKQADERAAQDRVRQNVFQTLADESLW